MRVEYLNHERVSDFVEYCKKHKNEVDDSFLYEDQLTAFTADEQNPTYIISDERGLIIAAASLMITDYFRTGRKARFRIFHSEVERPEYYQALLQSILKHTDDLNELFLFVPFSNSNAAKSFEQVKFEAERYTFLLLREDLPVPDFAFLDEYKLIPFQLGRDEEAWCTVRNEGFAKLRGSETPVTPDMVARMMSEEDHIEGASLILYYKDRPVGVIRGAVDEYEDRPIMNIGPIAIIPEFQGKGLGRNLLRHLLNVAKEMSYDRTILCVNEENERAKALYIQEGFKLVNAVTCYTYDLKRKS